MSTLRSTPVGVAKRNSSRHQEALDMRRDSTDSLAKKLCAISADEMAPHLRISSFLASRPAGSMAWQ